MKRLILISLILVPCLASSALAEKSKRGVSVMPPVEAGSLPMAGDYWALIIGIDQYQSVPRLKSAVRDAQAVREVLIQRYGFSRDHVIEIIDAAATRRGIEDSLYQLRKKAGPNDSVFIYYAGHGQMDQEDQIGYWVPVEGEAQSPGTFISNARIRDEIARMKAKHVYLVADSCFSGSLFASGRALPPLNDKFFQRLYANKSRWGLTSGMNEPVTDQGKDGHSMFAYFFLKLLKENDSPYLVPSHIYDQIAPLIGRNTDQQPRSEPLQNAGDEGGQFIFRLVAASGRAALSTSPAEDSLAAERQRLEEERRKLQAERERMEADKMLASDERSRQQIGSKQTEAERQRMAMEKARQDSDAERQGQVEAQRQLDQQSSEVAHLQSRWPTLEATLLWLKENVSEERAGATNSSYSLVNFNGCTLVWEENNYRKEPGVFFDSLSLRHKMPHRVNLSGMVKIEDGGAGLVLIQSQGLHYLYFKDKADEAIGALKLAARFFRGQG